MASSTSSYTLKKKHKMRSSGRKRKNDLDTRGTTPTRATFFGDAPKAKKA